MKKYLLLCFLLINTPVYSVDEYYYSEQPDIIIQNTYKPYNNINKEITEDKIYNATNEQMKIIPKYLKERKIHYDFNGRPQTAPVSTNEILLDF